MSDSPLLDRHNSEFADVEEAWEETGCLPETGATETELATLKSRKIRERMLELVKSA